MSHHSSSGGGGGGKLTPNLDQQSTKLLNLTVLQRIDPHVEDILLTAAHVAFYEFNIDLSQWSRKDVEGSLFVVKRNVEPWYQFIVMNRRNTENLVENLSGDLECEIQVPYLMYRNAAQEEVNGIWFYNSRECEEVANLFNRIIESFKGIPSKPPVSNISEYKELEPVPSMRVMEGPLEPSVAPTSNSHSAESTSFTKFFNTAMNLGNNTSNFGAPAQEYTHTPSSVLPSSVGLSNLLPSRTSSFQMPSTAALAPSAPLIHHPDISDPIHRSHPNVSDSYNRNSQVENLVKPSVFFTPHSFYPPHPSTAASMPPTSSSVPHLGPQPSSMTLQRPYGSPLLQPFPPPTPSPSLTPSNPPVPTYGPIIDRDKVREALMMLAQDNQFIDMVYKALHQAHHT